MADNLNELIASFATQAAANQTLGVDLQARMLPAIQNPKWAELLTDGQERVAVVLTEYTADPLPQEASEFVLDAIKPVLSMFNNAEFCAAAPDTFKLMTREGSPADEYIADGCALKAGKLLPLSFVKMINISLKLDKARLAKGAPTGPTPVHALSGVPNGTALTAPQGANAHNIYNNMNMTNMQAQQQPAIPVTAVLPTSVDNNTLKQLLNTPLAALLSLGNGQEGVGQAATSGVKPKKAPKLDTFASFKEAPAEQFVFSSENGTLTVKPEKKAKLTLSEYLRLSERAADTHYKHCAEAYTRFYKRVRDMWEQYPAHALLVFDSAVRDKIENDTTASFDDAHTHEMCQYVFSAVVNGGRTQETNSHNKRPAGGPADNRGFNKRPKQPRLPKSETLCKFDAQGCKKEGCPFMHQNPRRGTAANGTGSNN